MFACAHKLAPLANEYERNLTVFTNEMTQVVKRLSDVTSKISDQLKMDEQFYQWVCVFLYSVIPRCGLFLYVLLPFAFATVGSFYCFVRSVKISMYYFDLFFRSTMVALDIHYGDLSVQIYKQHLSYDIFSFASLSWNKGNVVNIAGLYIHSSYGRSTSFI